MKRVLMMFTAVPRMPVSFPKRPGMILLFAIICAHLACGGGPAGKSAGASAGAAAPPDGDAIASVKGRLSSVFDPEKGHAYPRRVIALWGGPGIDWYSRFDLVLSRDTDAGFARAIKDLNPDAYVVSMRQDWNTGGGIAPFPEEWCIYKSNGEIAGDTYCGDCLCWANFSNYALPSAMYGGTRYNEYLGQYFAEGIDMTVYDGVASDGVWENPYHDAIPDVDLDRDGQNDWDQHGRAWLTDQWGEGRAIMLDGIRGKIGEEKMILLCSGRFHEFNWRETNGLFLEMVSCEFSWDYTMRIYSRWMEAAREPHILIWGADRLESKEDFTQARFQMASVMYGDGYIKLSDVPNGEMHFVNYYDEFDVNLGWPTGEMRRIKSSGENGQGVYARFFDNGAVLLNQDDAPATVTDDDLRSLPGYNGPYYHFQGGQDPSVNNGEKFASDVLDGRLGYTDICWFGDGRILTREPTTAVSEIIIDNVPHHTSPASSAAVLEGDWTQECAAAAWDQGCAPWKEQYSLAFNESGAGRAVFTPSINVEGEYEVWEWHGDLGDRQEAGGVVFRVTHASGTQDIAVDLGSDQGKWNHLGRFAFNAGTGGNVTILADGTNGPVVADAVRFVFTGNFGNIKGEPGAGCTPGAERSCSGALGCPGARTCLEGGSWGPCESRPEDEEKCGDGIDNDCNGLADDPEICPMEKCAFEMFISADDSYTAYLDGVELGQDDEWTDAERFESELAAGKHVIAVHAINGPGPEETNPAGLLVHATSCSETLESGTAWLASPEAPGGWTAADYDDGAWEAAAVVAEYGGGVWAGYHGGVVDGVPDGSKARWIWLPETAPGQEAFFRRTFVIENNGANTGDGGNVSGNDAAGAPAVAGGGCSCAHGGGNASWLLGMIAFSVLMAGVWSRQKSR